MKGTKRHLLVDLLGFPLHPVVHDAGIQDRGPHSLERYKEKAQKAEIVPGWLSRADHGRIGQSGKTENRDRKAR